MRGLRAIGTVATSAALLASGCETANLDGPAVDARVLWNVGIPTLGPPAWDDSSIYFSSRLHSVVAVNRATGAVRWTGYCCTIGDWITTERSPARTGNVLVFGDDDLVGFDAHTGVRLWTFTRDNGELVRAGVNLFQADGGRVYTGSYLGAAFALDATTGAVLWRTNLESTGNPQVRIHAVRDGRVYLTVRYGGPFYSAAAYALDAGSGAVLWRYDMGRSSISHDVALTAPNATSQLLLVALDDGSIAALSAQTGEERWVIDRPSPTNPSERQLVVVGDRLVASATLTAQTGDYLAAYDLATGNERWRVESEQGSVWGYYNMMASDGAHVYPI
ncbi:MAG TPA: PQQ-binding-like beta-propeller repeat protein, partial [Gemmatimonadaceae bacterium]|nr:PQQ-binding-like beta-propeller repeat protein [Gemmatimonadaceae bacterium]